MSWVKKGLVYEPDLPWATSHAQVPTPIYIPSKEIIRVFFSSRNRSNKSLISYVDLNADDPSIVVGKLSQPILEIGRPGTFDDSGIMPSWALYNRDKIYLYYIGWNVRNTVPYYNSIGLAISKDHGDSFEKFSEGPLWDRNAIEPYFSASSCVIIEDGIWKNWYLSCTEYREVLDRLEPRYHIKYAESLDGISWSRKGLVAIDYKSDQEAGIVKASVIVEDGKYKMWYSYRNFENYRTNPENSYKIGYAESDNGMDWIRLDEKSEIGLSSIGWDSEMMCYPHVIDVKDRRYMFYNGNDFGKDGFGFAEYKKK